MSAPGSNCLWFPNVTYLPDLGEGFCTSPLCSGARYWQTSPEGAMSLTVSSSAVHFAKRLLGFEASGQVKLNPLALFPS
jgi:hypothetical protein